jgi:hypothetical protein
MAYEMFNGWKIVPMPSSPKPSSIHFSMSDAVGETVSPFTRQTQEQEWPGGDYWELDIQLPPLTSRPRSGSVYNAAWTQIGTWRGWLAALHGKANVFSVGDPLATAPTGSPGASVPVCVNSTSENQATASYIYTSGWVASTSGLLLPGDYIQLGKRLHVVAGVSSVDSDASGNATIEIWPSLRESAAGVSIGLTNCTGLFRLADNKREFSENVTRLFGLTFKAIEAR